MSGPAARRRDRIGGGRAIALIDGNSFYCSCERVTGIPECTDAAARELVRRVVEDGPNAKLQNFRLITLDEFRQVVYSAEAQERHCTTTALLNAGRRRISWAMYRREGMLIAEIYGL
ncbi:hypothetical protein HNR00_001220 [Methylorubrum rhodinum]|uniref:Uncharacterized protein n=1 Tax=Methylorubrum rhodinum TaxID=29428 RepID=A0A840ZF02_9HYPH|nr:hypothetical protein [Methylorubrum rhodinum]MBB5756522.1 hypothetical protein [Methylorubrum rhodinum]